MTKRDLKKQQKKKKRQNKELARNNVQSVLPYEGAKYKKPDCVPIMFQTELGVHQADRLAKGRLTDWAVRDAVVSLVQGLRRGNLSPLDSTEVLDLDATNPAGQARAIQKLVRTNWTHLEPAPSHDTLIGVLRTLMSSVETWGSRVPNSRGYLRFLEGFMRKAGVRLAIVENAANDQPASELDDLLAVGRSWCNGVDDAGDRFRLLSAELIEAGNPEVAAAACRQLIEEFPETGHISELTAIADGGPRSTADSPVNVV